MFLTGLLLSNLSPPSLGYRTVSADSAPIVGYQRTISLGDRTISLLIPRELGVSCLKGGLESVPELWIHFHGPAWLTFQEHERAKTNAPVLNISVGEGSSVYGKFANEFPKIQNLLDIASGEIDRWLEENNVKNQSKFSIKFARLTSFSAGYGAARAYLKSEENTEKIQSIILCDSLYASLDPTSPVRAALPEHMKPFLNYIKQAENTKKSFLLSVSSVKTPTYASSEECASALVKAIGCTWNSPLPSDPASIDTKFPLIRYAVFGNNAILHYGGDGADAHTTHYRNLASLIEFQKTIIK